MAAPAAVTTFASACAAFSAAATANVNDPTLPSQLAALPPLCANAIVALRAKADPEVGSATAACEVLLAQCSSLMDALSAQSPPRVTWTVPQPMPLAAIATQLYGASAAAHFDELRANNPGAFDDVLVRAGTVLNVATVL